MRLLALALALAGCAVPAEKHAVDGGGAPFACLGKPLPTTASAQVTISGTVADPFTGKMLGTASVQGFLVGVMTPIFTTTTDASGAFSQAQGTGGVPRDAYLQASLNGYLSTTVFPAVPIASDYAIGVQMFTANDIATLASVAQVPLDMTKAQIVMQVVDCNGTPVGGATVTTDPPGTVRYFVNATPSPTAVATDAMSGVALIANVPPSNTTVNATVNGMTLRSHSFDAVAGGLIQTAIQP